MGRFSRRDVLRSGAAALLSAAGAGCVTPLSMDRDGSSTVGLEQVATGLTAPVGYEAPEDGGPRYVPDQVGVVRVIDDGGLRPDPLIDLEDATVDVGGRLDRFDERGLLGLALHPDFAQNRRLYVRYSAPPRPSTPEGYDHTFVLSEFRASEDGLTADPETERTVLEIPEPQSNHNSGAIVFGPDGNLYVGVGDGGGSGDRGTGHVEDWYEGVPGGNGQDVTENLLGSVLRIDVDGRDPGKPYAVPPDNPLVGREGLDEQYAWGLRNPWRMSFHGDRLIVADVGQERYEEVNVVGKGGNYGWNVTEGRSCFEAEACPDTAPDGRPLRDPVVQYPHGGADVSGVAVVGGYVYRGDAAPTLRGRYVFSDWRAGGRLFVADPEGDTWPVRAVGVRTVSGRAAGQYVLAFGEDPGGELYVLTSDSAAPRGTTGGVYRVVEV